MESKKEASVKKATAKATATAKKATTAKKAPAKKEAAAAKATVEKKAVAKKPAARKSVTLKSNPRAGQPRGHRVVIKYLGEPGRQVFVAGSFNEWNATAKQLLDEKGNGEYFVRFLLKAGVYQYKLVVDGQWILDPNNNETAPNEFGTQNNVLTVSEDND